MQIIDGAHVLSHDNMKWIMDNGLDQYSRTDPDTPVELRDIPSCMMFTDGKSDREFSWQWLNHVAIPKLRRTAEGVEFAALFTIQDMCSSQFGMGKWAPIGPNNTFKTLAEAKANRLDTELASTAKWFTIALDLRDWPVYEEKAVPVPEPPPKPLPRRPKKKGE